MMNAWPPLFTLSLLLACGPVVGDEALNATDSGSTSASGASDSSGTTGEASGPPISTGEQPTTGDATTSSGLTEDSQETGTITGSDGSSSGEPECGCVGQRYDIDLDESVGGYSAQERLAMLPESATLRWTAVPGSPETTITLTVTPELESIRYGEGGDPCPFVIDPCLEGFAMFALVDFATDDGSLVGAVRGRVSHDEASNFYPGIVMFGDFATDTLDPAFFEQVYQDEDGNPFVPEALEILILVDPNTGELEEFTILEYGPGPVIAELVPE